MALSAALATALFAAAGAQAVPTAAHDAGTVRAVGVGFTGLFRALDLVVAAPLAIVPLGTRALRAGLASALVAAACAAVAAVFARDLAETVVPDAIDRAVRPSARAEGRRGPVSRRLLAAVAAASVLSATLCPAWQDEAAAPGGAVLGALLVLLVLRTAVAAGPDEEAAPVAPVAMLLLGLAASYEPLTLASALAALMPHVRRLRPRSSAAAIRAALAFVLGLSPLAIGAATTARDPRASIVVPALSFFEARARSAGPLAFARTELGWVVLVAAAIGAALALLVPRARSAAASLLGLVAIGAISLSLGPSGAAVLAAVVAVHALAALALAAVVVLIARAPVPLASASAALVVVLEMVLPIRAADETASARAERDPRAAAWFDEIAWGPAPPGAAVLVVDRALFRRAAAAFSVGELRPDLLVVPLFAVPGRAGDFALAAEPKLAAVYRDVALGAPPEELSFASLAEARPVLASFDPKGDRALARHLVPVGLFSRYDAEPRGMVDRRKAFEPFDSKKQRLVRIAVSRRDADLAQLTATQLRSRAIGIAASGDRDLLARALDDLRPFSPDDPVASTLVRRIVTTKGPIDVSDLPP